MIDGGLLDRVDACRQELGQTRRLFVERALLEALGGAPVSLSPLTLAHAARSHQAKRAVQPRPKGGK